MGEKNFFAGFKSIRITEENEYTHCVIKNLLFIIIFSLIIFSVILILHFKSIVIFYNEHWDYECSVMVACSILEPYYALDKEMFFIRPVAHSQKHRNLIYLYYIYLPIYNILHLFKKCQTLKVILFSADIRVEMQLNVISLKRILPQMLWFFSVSDEPGLA